MYSRKEAILSSKKENSYQKGLGMSSKKRPEEPGLKETGRQRRGKGQYRKLRVLLRRQVPAEILYKRPQALQAEVERDLLQRDYVCDGQAGGSQQS